MNRPVLESRVMGQLPVVVLGTLLGACGVVQLLGFNASSAIMTSGGRDVDVIWSLCMVIATAGIWAAWLMRQSLNALSLEIAGIWLLAFAQAAFGYAILSIEPAWALEGRLVVLAYVISGIVNTIGRTIYLRRQYRVLSRLMAQACPTEKTT